MFESEDLDKYFHDLKVGECLEIEGKAKEGERYKINACRTAENEIKADFYVTDDGTTEKFFELSIRKTKH